MREPCYKCKFEQKPIDQEPCDHCSDTYIRTGDHPAFQWSKALTNYDLLIRKTPEELAEWIETIADCSMCKIDETHCSGGGLNTRASCMIHWLDWLRQEADT